jgi:small-conductance mechanosensitive channel
VVAEPRCGIQTISVRLVLDVVVLSYFPSTTTQYYPNCIMPIPIIQKGVQEGLSSIPYAYTVLRIAPWVLILAALKFWFGGARNRSERLMHSKVVMITVSPIPNKALKLNATRC